MEELVIFKKLISKWKFLFEKILENYSFFIASFRDYDFRWYDLASRKGILTQGNGTSRNFTMIRQNPSASQNTFLIKKNIEILEIKIYRIIRDIFKVL